MTTRFLLLSLAAVLTARAELRLPAIIGDNMVLQQKQTNPVWGWDAPGSKVTVKFAGQSKSGECDAKGRWTVKLDPVPANTRPQSMTIEGSSKRELKNILVGEVWLCSGQSNMGFNVGNAWDADLEIATAKHPLIRLISVPQAGTQEIQDDFKGQWEPCSPANAGQFTAVGFFFGRLLHEMLGVPVGLIDNAWGGSACEAWVRREVLEKDARFAELIARWKDTEAKFNPAEFEKQAGEHKAKVQEWAKARREAIKAGKPEPAQPPRAPQNPMTGQHRPGNLYAGVLHPVIGYGIKGAIWYQGESNAGRAQEYATLFPLMIQHWRDEWKSGDFPFYWVQLADFKAEQPEPGDSDWAELRESQTKTMSLLKNTGQAVITDLGEGNDIHPKNKRDVAERLARWALAKDYGIKIPFRSPELKSCAIEGSRAIVTVDTFGSSLRTMDVSEPRGFAICGDDRKWVWATAKLAGPDKIEASSPKVPKPVAVRYAWADNPVANVLSKDGLPLTPFRTDNFPMITDAKALAEKAAALKKLAAARKQREEVRKAEPAKAPAKK
jgi:sialate O-acetylesterase